MVNETHKDPVGDRPIRNPANPQLTPTPPDVTVVLTPPPMFMDSRQRQFIGKFSLSLRLIPLRLPNRNHTVTLDFDTRRYSSRGRSVSARNGDDQDFRGRTDLVGDGSRRHPQLCEAQDRANQDSRRLCK